MSLFMLLTNNQKIEYSPQGFTYMDMFRVTHKYDYSQVKKIRYSKDVFINVGHRIILIDSMTYNGKKFARVAMKYSKNAKIITHSNTRLFNGNVHNPEEFIFVYILISLIPVAFLISSLFGFKEIKLQNLEVSSSTISEFSFDKSDEDSERISIAFKDCEGTFFSRYIDENSAEYYKFQEDFKKGKIFDGYYLSDDTDSDGLIKIYQLSCGEEIYILLKNINEDNCETKISLLIIFGIILCIWLLYIIISTYVMCNADKYPKLIKIFVKSDYIVKK